MNVIHTDYDNSNGILNVKYAIRCCIIYFRCILADGRACTNMLLQVLFAMIILGSLNMIEDNENGMHCLIDFDNKH